MPEREVYDNSAYWFSQFAETDYARLVSRERGDDQDQDAIAAMPVRQTP